LIQSEEKVDASITLYNTQKGKDEIQHRTYKLNIKKRSLLILLETPHSVEEVMRKTVFPHNEVADEILALIQEGFIRQGTSDEAPSLGTAVSQSASGSPQMLQLDDEIILSEAKFLLSDFCVDSFGTQSKGFAEDIRACQDTEHIRQCLNKIFALTSKHCPEHLPRLLEIVKEINDTA
jgi:hypothetical protein